MLGEWLPFTSPGYPSTHTGPATLPPNLEYSVSVSLISPLLSQTFFSLICLSSLAFTIHLISLSISLVHPSFSPLFCHSSLPHPFFFFSCSLSPFPLLFSFSHPHSLLPALLEVSTLWVLLTSHLLWCELHICEWMTGKINNPVFPFSLTVGLSNE